MSFQLNGLTRRRFLLITSALLSSTALSTNPVFADSSPVLVAPQAVDGISFIGLNKIQLTIIENEMTDPGVRPVVGTEDVRFLRPHSLRHAGWVEVDGEKGLISGGGNLEAPRLFRELAKVIEESTLDLGEGGKELHDPDQWQVTVDGEQANIRHLYRKSSPIKSERADVGAYNHTLRHVLTFELGTVVADGAEVEFTSSVLGTIKVDRSDTFSEAIHVCQQGYALSGPKKGFVGLWNGHSLQGTAGTTDEDLSEALRWRLLDAVSDETVLSGRLQIAQAKEHNHRNAENFNGCDIYVADFSGFSGAGEFKLSVDGIGHSFPFTIEENPYADCFRAAARWYFHQRSGIEIAAPYGEGRTRPRNGHPEDGLTVWQSDVELGPTREGYASGDASSLVRETERLGLLESEGNSYPTGSENPSAWGGWHDAGDWDRRIQHMDAVFVMANIVEIFGKASQVDLNLPESGRPFADADVLSKKSADDIGDGETVLPDLIHEALWGISLWRRTQTADGGIIGGVEYGRVGTAGAVSWNPHQGAFAYKTEPWAAYRFAIAAAKLGHVISNTVGDAVLGASLISEASAAWDWAESTWEDFLLEAGDDVPSSVFNARVAAAACLYRANGTVDAREVFEAYNPFAPKQADENLSTRKGVFGFEQLEYLRAARDGRDFSPNIVNEMQEWAALRMTGPNRMGRDFGLHTTTVYPRGRGWARFGPASNWFALPLAMQFSTGLRRYDVMRNILIEGMWFGLGCNPSNTSFVQGFGSRQFADPSGSDYEGFPKVPGQISFGVAAGDLFPWEAERIEGQLYPSEQGDWPAYAQIFESSAVNICAEHGMKSNAMEWLFANAFLNELLTQ